VILAGCQNCFGKSKKRLKKDLKIAKKISVVYFNVFQLQWVVISKEKYSKAK
jgi:hypothetical protein